MTGGGRVPHPLPFHCRNITQHSQLKPLTSDEGCYRYHKGPETPPVLRHAAEVIRQLNASLNLEAGGELAQTLRRLYVYFDARLMESNLQKRRDGVDEVVGHITGIRDAWATMLTRLGSDGAESTSQAAALPNALVS